MLLKVSIFTWLLPSLVLGHGNMVYPPIWQDKEAAGWYWTQDGHGSNNHIGCGVLDLPEDNEYSNVHDGTPPDCMKMWYSNHVEIPGEATIPEFISQSDITCTHQAGHHDYERKFPWNSPGSAPVFGPCGNLGGNPLGCQGDGEGKFGDCCSHHCDAFAMGDNAEAYPWDSPTVTEWRTGSYQEVAWYCGANHAGGYSYRLCKTPEGGISELTEECFQQTPLQFVGDLQWVQYGLDRKSGHRTELVANRTTEGTSPPGSMWTANPLIPHDEDNGDHDHGHGHIIDNIHVPTDLEPGEYVLSFRWDCKCSPQVWGACANILIK